jgi:hypothetical protein
MGKHRQLRTRKSWFKEQAVQQDPVQASTDNYELVNAGPRRNQTRKVNYWQV